MVVQSHSRANSLTGIGDRKGINYPSYVKCGQNTLGTGQFPQANALCVEEKVIGGETSNILGKGVITMAEEVIIRRTTPTGILDKYRAIGSRVRAINSQSP